jgi:biopolymer transport protein ExbD
MPRKSKARDEAPSDANVLPVLNIMFLLIPALLLAMEVASMAAIDVTPPRIGPSTTGTPPTDPASLRFRVHLASDGIQASHAGTDALPGAEDNIPLGPEGHDFEALEALAVDLKAAAPTNELVTISADSDVTMDVLVAAMDAVRGSKCRQPGTDEERSCLFWRPVVSAG